MLLDLSPYKIFKKKTDPAGLTDPQIAAGIEHNAFILSNLRGYSSQVAHAAFFAFPAAGMIALAFTGLAASGIPLFAAIAASYAVYKIGGSLMCKGVVRAVHEKRDLETEQEVRVVRRQIAAQEDAEREIKLIRDRARQAKEAFNAAVEAGLPLEQAIQVRKSPLTFKAGSRRGFLRFGF